MVVMNIAMYGFTVVAARLLLPHDFGAVTALLGIILVGSVASLGLQASVARRLAVAPDQHDQIVTAARQVTVVAALAVGALVALSTFVLTPVLRLEHHGLVALCGLTLVPLTAMGTQMGVAQGSRRWGAFVAVNLASGLGRLGTGGVALLIDRSPTAAMIGIAVGAWMPVAVGAGLLRTGSKQGVAALRRTLGREALLGSHALLAYFVLSNIDSLIARNRFDAQDSGLYASGLILAKAALFFPQFVSVVVFPDLARDGSSRARLRAVALVGAFGALAVGCTVALPQIALVLVGGDQYAEVGDSLWLFALSGSVLAIVHLLLFDALARHAHGIVVMLWCAVVVLGGSAYLFDVGLVGLVTTVSVVAAVLAVSIWTAATWRERRLARTV